MLAKLRSHIGVLIVLLALVMGGSYFYQVHQEEARAACQTRFNSAFTANLTIRSQLSSERQDAEDSLLVTISSLVLHPGTTAADKQVAARDYVAAFQTYQMANEAYVSSKDAHPLPTLPSC